MTRLRSTLGAAAVGALVGGVLLWASGRAWRSPSPTSVEGCAAVAQRVAASLVLLGLHHARFGLSAAPRLRAFLLRCREVFTAALIAAVIPALLAGLAPDLATLEHLALRQAADAALLAVLAGTLFEALREHRTLAAGFLTLSWVLPALLAVSVPVDATGGAANPPRAWTSMCLDLWPWMASLGALMLTMTVIRPKMNAE